MAAGTVTRRVAAVGVLAITLAAALVQPQPAPTYPLSTSSRWVVDATGRRAKFACVNWSGAAQLEQVPGGLDHQHRNAIAALIRRYGFNCVRLPFSLQLVEENPVVRRDRLSANPDLQGSTALAVLDAVIDALGAHNVSVVLDNHMSRGDWCCNEKDGNGLWYTDDYPEANWVRDWQTMARRYRHVPHVVAAELRNEPRCATVGGVYRCPTWGDGHAPTDWHAAATRCGNAVLAVNPSLLVIVDGINYALNLRGVYSHPVALNVSSRVVYVAHDYSFSQAEPASYSDLSALLGDSWGYILATGKPYTAPVWVSEFGTPHANPAGTAWWGYFTQYLTDADIDWGYWRVDGTESNGTSRTFGAPALYGVLNATWNGPAAGGVLLKDLQALQPATQGPK